MSFWHWTQFHLFLKAKSLQALINKGNIVFFSNTKFLYFHIKKRVSRYLLNTHWKVSKKVSKICFNIFRHQKTPKFGVLIIYHSSVYIFYQIHMAKRFIAFGSTFRLLRAFGIPFLPFLASESTRES